MIRHILGKSIFNRIEFWVVLFFLVRLIGITNPPLESGHNWRQVTGLMVAQNFFENPSIFYPSVHETQGESGIIGMEFPSLNYLHFMVSKLFGYDHWYGRLLNLIVSSIGVLFFYKIIRLFFNHKHALASSIILLGSIWFTFSRKMMPDTYCISLMFIGVFYGISYLEKARISHLIFFIFFTSLAVLSKIPAVIYFVLFIPLWWKTKELKVKGFFAIASLIPMLLMSYWYFFWNPYLETTYGNWYNIGQTLFEGAAEIKGNLILVFKRFYFDAFSSYFFFLLFLLGLGFAFYHKNRKVLVPFSLVFLLFVGYIFKSGYFFFHHSYYIIPFVPVMAFLAGYAVSIVRKKSVFILLLVLGLGESIANQQHDFFIKETEKYKMTLEAIADEVSAKDDLIAISGEGNPQELYFANRKGWVYYEAEIINEAYLNELKDKGCAFVFVNQLKNPIQLDEKKVFENEFYKVYALK